MERTALRMATVAALLHGGHGPPWPTLAGEFVYDSMMDDITDVVPTQRKPVIVVRTDDDAITYKGHAFAGRQVRLLIEFGVLTASMIKTVDGQSLPRVDWPRTDSALEAFLDMMELQIWSALFGHSEWAMWWQHCGMYGGSRSGYTSSAQVQSARARRRPPRGQDHPAGHRPARGVHAAAGEGIRPDLPALAAAHLEGRRDEPARSAARATSRNRSRR